MPTIRPSTYLRNKYSDISATLHQCEEPIFITEGGREDSVMLSVEAYDRIAAKEQLYSLLEEGLREIEAGNVLPAREVMASIRRKPPKKTRQEGRQPWYLL